MPYHQCRVDSQHTWTPPQAPQEAAGWAEGQVGERVRLVYLLSGKAI